LYVDHAEPLNGIALDDVALEPAVGAPLVAMRSAAILLIGGWMGLLVWLDALGWQAGVIASSLVPIGYVSLRTIQGREVPGRMILLGMLGAQSGFVTVTGGIHSPLCAVLVVTAVLAAFSVPTRRQARPIVLASVLLLVALAGLEMSGRTVSPPALAGASAAVHAAAAAGTLIVLVLVAARVGAAVRDTIRERDARVVAFRGEALAALSARNRDLVSITGALAHELKNPLTAIRGLSTFLADEATPGSPQAEQLAVLVAEVRRTSRIVDEFLDVSRPLDPTGLDPVALGPLLDGILTVHQGIASGAGLRLRRRGPDISVRCDARKVHHIAVNLLHNAIQASPAGGTVEARLEATADTVRLIVDDEGPGVDPDRVADVFRPGVTTRGTGSGLGLPIALALAQAHGGRLDLGPRPGGGARAVLTLPTGGPTTRPIEWRLT